MSESKAFHLAWCRHYTNLFATSPEIDNLFYALVPLGMSGFVDAFRLKVVSDCGRPGASILATQYDLRSLRSPDLRPGTEDPSERALIQALQSRAHAANHVLPVIESTTVMPGWSRMPLPAAQVRELRLVGGWKDHA
jgi:hypothetical protein